LLFSKTLLSKSYRDECTESKKKRLKLISNAWLGKKLKLNVGISKKTSKIAREILFID